MRREVGNFSSSGRGLAEFERARRHSLFVRYLKIGLPLGGVLVIAGIALTLFLKTSGTPSITLDEVKVEDGKLVMDNPEVTGSDPQNRPYSFTATRATQDAAKPTQISLDDIRAHLPMGGTQQAHVDAGTGLYDADAKTLELGNDVVLRTDDGMTVQLQQAHVDINSSTMSSTLPVIVDTARARVTAGAMEVRDKGKTVAFTGNVRVVLQPAEGGALKESPLRGQAGQTQAQ